MSFQFKRSESIPENVRRIAREQIDKSIRVIDGAGMDPNEVIHQVRTRCKKLRGLIRLVRPGLGKTYSRENTHIRDAARLLSAARDKQVMIETHDTLLKQSDSTTSLSDYAFVRRELSSRHEDEASGTVDERLKAFRGQMQIVRARVHTWKLKSGGYDAIADGLRSTHHQARQCLEIASKNSAPQSLHELRKHVKYHWHQAKLLEPLWPEMFTAYTKQVNRLGQFLGDHHNLHVLRDTIHRSSDSHVASDDLSSYTDLIDRLSRKLAKQSLTLGRRIFAEPSDAFVARNRVYWKLWR